VQLYLIRHGETDWNLMSQRGVKGLAASLAPLTPLGRIQIETIANDYRLQEADAILCSSFARALESAALLSRKTNKPLYVEYDLHEWLPQKDPTAVLTENLLLEASKGLHQEIDENVFGDNVPWESIAEVRQRVMQVFERYRKFSKIIVVTHAVVISSLLGVKRSVDYAEIVPFELEFEKTLVGSGKK
jgi:broad specificity phosphatase PhoE